MISVVIPVFQSAAHLARCLDALATSTLAPLETIVVDDGSTDGSGEIARRANAVVVGVPNGPRGPAVARNLGAAHARGDILFFLDADVAVHPDTLAEMSSCLEAHADVAAVFGSYDARPDHVSTVSQYRNLLHHHLHQRGRREASTFWAGCGAIRRQVFEQLGGFDERYTRPSIEDIELGVRLRAAGHRIWLRPEIQVTHLKRWTFAEIVWSDVADRAIPWTRLILDRAHLPQDLNTSMTSRVSAVAAWTAVGALAVGFVRPRALWVGVLAGTVVFVLNAGLYRFFLRTRGVAFAAAAAGMHTLYLLYSSAVFGVLAVGARLPGSRRPPAL